MSSCSKCNRKPTTMNTNASNKRCLSRMQDGRAFTDYRPRCTIQYQFKDENELKSSYDTRMFLTRNADDLMKANLATSEKENICEECYSKNETGTMLPEKNSVKCNSRTCDFQKDVNMYGLGTGRVYNN